MSAIQTYTKDIEAKFKSNRATEHTYRRDLEVLLEMIGGDKVQVINEPKRKGSNAPDYYISRDVLTIGFVEAKDIDKNLSVVENSEQLNRYRESYNNLLLTNYLDFRWYIEGDFTEQVTIGTLDKGKIRFDDDKFDALAGMLRRYYAAEVPEIISPEDLARRMAKMTRELARLIEEALANTDDPPTDLISKKEAVARVLLPNLDNRQFADMYAQTIAYGLFAARARYDGKPELFTLETAFFQLPKTNPFLGKLFQNIAAELDTRVKFMADVIAQLLAYAKGLDEVIADFGHSTRQADPVIHFYETFLNAYDATQRERRGVYYTPEPVVSYIVRSVDHILRETFGRSAGLADTETLILDPATGTGTFLYKVIQEIHDSMAGNMGMWQSYVQKNLLKRLFGFELLMAPYTVAHMKLNLLLGELGYNFESDDRLEIYLTNTLEENVQQPTLPFAEYLTDEANAATRVKREKPIMVVLGNPPYSAESANTGDWITKLVRESYYPRDDIKEQNPKPLLDDYVKFIRFGQWRVNKTGSGVLAFVTNHGYLDNPTFRTMRQSLMETFDSIYLINLHGNSRKKETNPNGGPDNNVFDIQQGVSIGIFIKEVNSNTKGIYHVDLWGNRQHKYQWLLENDIKNTVWKKLLPKSPFYLFVPHDTTALAEYEKGYRITDIFPVHSSGMNTLHDSFAVSFDKKTIEQRFKDFINPQISDAEYRRKHPVKDSRDWKLSTSRKKLQSQIQDDAAQRETKISELKKSICKCLYKPFDVRWMMLIDEFVGYARWETTRSFLDEGAVGFATSRQALETISCFPSNIPFGQHKIVDPYNRSYIFPVYIYPDNKELFNKDEGGSAWSLSDKGRRPNLNPDFVKDMESKLGLRFVPEQPTPTPASLRLASPPQSIGEGESDVALKSSPDASGGDLEGGECILSRRCVSLCLCRFP